MERARPSDRHATRCPYCHDALAASDPTATRCRACGAPHHAGCWRENMGCATCRAPDGDGGDTFVIVSRRRVEEGRAGPVPEGAGVAARPRLEQLEAGDLLVLRRTFPRQACGALFLAVWLTGWLVGEVAVSAVLLGALFTGKVFSLGGLGTSAFLGLWLALWTVGGLAAIAAFLHLLGAQQRLELGRDEVLFRRVGPFGLPLSTRSRAQVADVRDVRVEGDRAVIEHRGGRIEWQLTPDEAGWVVTRARAHLGLDGPKG